MEARVASRTLFGRNNIHGVSVMILAVFMYRFSYNLKCRTGRVRVHALFVSFRVNQSVLLIPNHSLAQAGEDR